MTTWEVWPCDQCGSIGARNFGNRGYCAAHLGELLAMFDPAAFRMSGVGVLHGFLRPELGPTYADLICVACGATWTGPVGERCQWCRNQRDRMIADQRTAVLDNPTPDRLAVAVIAGIITKVQAELALARREAMA